MSNTMTDLAITKIAAAEMGRTAWPTIIFAFVSAGAFFGVIAVTALGLLPLWVSFFVVSYLVYVVYTPLHESVHNNIAGDNAKLKWVNNVIGHVVGTILGTPYYIHYPGHMAHHRSTNVEGKDPDLVFRNGGFWDVITGGPRIILSEYKYYFREIYPKASLPHRAIMWSEISISVGWRVLLAVAGYPMEALVLGIFASIAGISLLGAIFAWIVHVPFDKTARYENTVTVFLPKWIHGVGTVAWLWQNYHSIHHLFPRVPFYRYEKVHDQIYQGMAERGAPTMGRPVVPSMLQNLDLLTE